MGCISPHSLLIPFHAGFGSLAKELLLQFPDRLGSVLLSKRSLGICILQTWRFWEDEGCRNVSILQMQHYWEYEGYGNVSILQTCFFHEYEGFGNACILQMLRIWESKVKWGSQSNFPGKKCISSAFPVDFLPVWPFPILSQALLGSG